jgi:hypothetical protein
MQVSASLWVAGFLLLLVQYLWRPGDDVHGLLLFVPLIFSLVSFVVSTVLGLARGTRLYRAAIALGLIGLVAIAAAVAFPFIGPGPGQQSGPSMGVIVLTTGVALSIGAGVVGAIAIARRRRGTGLRRTS